MSKTINVKKIHLTYEKTSDIKEIVPIEMNNDAGGEVCVEHVHILLEIPPKYSVSSVMGYIEGKSSY